MKHRGNLEQNYECKFNATCEKYNNKKMLKQKKTLPQKGAATQSFSKKNGVLGP